MDNKHEEWKQGIFVDKREYSHLSEEWKETSRRREQLLIRPSTFGNAICQAKDPETAQWIVNRLNLAARLERKLERIMLG